MNELEKNKSNKAFISLLLLMKRDLKIIPIGTFVETQENYEICRSMEIDVMQGHYIEHIANGTQQVKQEVETDE
jgi:EAL domain-containing protein (putative c-di-GMP-specific phosphodiesterase class I)